MPLRLTVASFVLAFYSVAQATEQNKIVVRRVRRAASSQGRKEGMAYETDFNGGGRYGRSADVDRNVLGNGVRKQRRFASSRFVEKTAPSYHDRQDRIEVLRIDTLMSNKTLEQDLMAKGVCQHDRSKKTPPCTGACADAAKDGIFLIGDSPVRRLTIRLMAQLEGLSDCVSDQLQLEVKGEIRQKNAGCIELNKSGARLRYCDTRRFDHDVIGRWIKDAKRDSFRTIYVGFPLAHMLHNPYDTCRCGGGYTESLVSSTGGRGLVTYIRHNFEGLVSLLGEDSSADIIFGQEVPSSSKDMPSTKDYVGACDQPLSPHYGKQCPACAEGCLDWRFDNVGLKKGNAIHKELFDKYASSKPHMHYFEMYNETLATNHFKDEVKRCWDKGDPWTFKSRERVHFLNPVLDEQLERIFENVRKYVALRQDTHLFLKPAVTK
jgi:hypothetical protein